MKHAREADKRYLRLQARRPLTPIGEQVLDTRTCKGCGYHVCNCPPPVARAFPPYEPAEWKKVHEQLDALRQFDSTYRPIELDHMEQPVHQTDCDLPGPVATCPCAGVRAEETALARFKAWQQQLRERLDIRQAVVYKDAAKSAAQDYHLLLRQSRDQKYTSVQRAELLLQAERVKTRKGELECLEARARSDAEQDRKRAMAKTYIDAMRPRYPRG